MKLKFVLLSLAAMCIGEISAQSYGAPYASVQCLNVELDGSITVRVTGMGRNNRDSKAQAQKNAVYNVIFKGVTIEDKSSPISRPLILEVNADEKYADFMNAFFADGGKFNDFISSKDARSGSKSRTKKDTQVESGITLRILRPQLKQYLIEQNIIKVK